MKTALVVSLVLAIALLSNTHAAEKPANQSPGLALSLTSGGKTDVSSVRLAALFVPEGQAPSPFLPVGTFQARFEGDIDSPLRADCTFGADLAGTVKVSVNGAEVLVGAKESGARLEGTKVRLNKGANHMVIEYGSPAKGDALYRLVWSSRDFPAEPVPPTVFLHHGSLPELVTSDRVREGRLLLAQLRCAACHDATGLLPPKGEGMPELGQDAPVFADFGARFQQPWLTHWVNNPHAIRPQSLMPKVFSGTGEEIDQRAADVAAYLATLGTPAPAPATTAEDLAPAGGALFANLGCLACHTPPEADGADEFHRVPLGHLKAKWQPAALRDYLKDPQKYFAWTRMPNFRLSDDELAQLTAFLLSGQQKEFAAGPKGDPARGGQLVVTAGCLNCHAGLPPTTAPKLADAFKAGAQRGCLAPDDKARGAAPDFALTAEQREGLLAFATSGFDSLKQDTPAEYARRQVANLRCNACHALDASVSVWSQLDNDMAALQAGAPAPEGEGQPIAGATAPPFTWFGEKLRTEWAADFIAGKANVKPRPWLIARMPSFATYAAPLAAGLAQQHGFPAAEPAISAPASQMVKAGEILLGENGGFNCITCHGVGARPPTAVFEAPGINLALATTRLRKEYYHRWVLFPQRIDPETKMPKFADDTGKTPLTDLFEGDAHQQYEAIWQYLSTQAVTKPAASKAP